MFKVKYFILDYAYEPKFLASEETELVPHVGATLVIGTKVYQVLPHSTRMLGSSAINILVKEYSEVDDYPPLL